MPWTQINDWLWETENRGEAGIDFGRVWKQLMDDTWHSAGDAHTYSSCEEAKEAAERALIRSR
jgi:hypothetical protein